MSETSIAHIKARSLNGSWWDQLARGLVFRALRQLRAARLLIEEDGQIFEFGEISEAESGSQVLSATIIVHHPSVYRCFAFAGSVGAGEAYMQGAWSSPSLVHVIRVFALNVDTLNKMESRWPWLQGLVDKIVNAFNANTLAGSKRNIAAHYDLSNDFFQLFLDPTMMYSSAVYPNAEATLEEASLHKLDTLCRKLSLNPGDHLLEIGTGWGGLAIYAAKHYGCRVTTTTISREQYEYAQREIEHHGLGNQITLLLQDYRKLAGQYDKLVSIEMIEAVGHEYYEDYFRICSSLLKADGLMVLQAITVADQRYQTARYSVDFIKKHIFPGGSLPSVAVIAECIRRKTDMVITGLEDIGLDYADTLRDWKSRFEARLPEVKELGFDDVFCRMWEFYLAYCEGGFRERAISTVQVVMAKPTARQF